MQKIVITSPEYQKGKAVFDQAEGVEIIIADGDEESLSAAILSSGTRVAIVGIELYKASLYSALSENAGDEKSLIVRYGVGCDNIDLGQLEKFGVGLANTPGTLDASVAEHAIWLMGSLARNVVLCDRKFKAGEFAGRSGIELAGRTLCIVGFGAIGQRVAKIAWRGFGMNVLAVGTKSIDEFRSSVNMNADELRQEFGIVEYNNDSDAVLGRADFVSLHIPSNEKTQHFISAELLKTFRPDSFLINTSRGPIVDEAALFDALSGNRIAGAGLDVFEREPYIPADESKDLRRLENVILTPHVGSNTKACNVRMAEKSLAIATDFLNGVLC